MKDWPELVLSLIADLEQYVGWLNDFAEDADEKIRLSIRADQEQAMAFIKHLKAHEVAEVNPHLDKLMRWDHSFNKPC